MSDAAPIGGQTGTVGALRAAVIFALDEGRESHAYVHLALTRLRAQAEHLIIVRPRAQADATLAALSDIGVDQWVECPSGEMLMMAAYQAGVAALPGGASPWSHVLLTGSHAYGPFVSIDEAVAAKGDAALYAAYPYHASLDDRIAADGPVARLDYALFRGDALALPAIATFWRSFKSAMGTWADFRTGAVGLAALLDDEGQRTVFSVDPKTLATVDPSIDEVHTLARAGAAVLPVQAFSMDPLKGDLRAIELRPALDAVRAKDPEIYATIVAHMLAEQELRSVTTNMDDYRVILDHAQNAGKSAWAFGRVAVFIHAYYVEMMPELWALIDRLPGQYDLFISTATSDKKIEIEAFLAEKGMPSGTADVRVVEQNRGRDMSSLFITFRDVVLSGKYEVALRLHSKRTPQVSARVAESFKNYLFDNLAHSEGYVRNLFDELEAHPDVGLVIPPAIHIGFGTMGHGWFANRQPLEALAQDMGFTITFDEHTPVAPYGTMYWFRTDALRRMFEWQWRWEDYNEEPHHIDGGLAHVQERLIAYCAQQAGYRTMSVMTPDHAARNYAKLEYKMQLMASRLPHGAVIFDRIRVSSVWRGVAAGGYERLKPLYLGVIKRAPWVRTMLTPAIRLFERIVLKRSS